MEAVRSKFCINFTSFCPDPILLLRVTITLVEERSEKVEYLFSSPFLHEITNIPSSCDQIFNQSLNSPAATTHINLFTFSLSPHNCKKPNRFKIWSADRFSSIIPTLIPSPNMPSVYGGPLTTFEDAEKESEYGYVRKVSFAVMVDLQFY